MFYTFRSSLIRIFVIFLAIALQALSLLSLSSCQKISDYKSIIFKNYNSEERKTSTSIKAHNQILLRDVSSVAAEKPPYVILNEEGLTAFQKQDYEAALEKFERAYRNKLAAQPLAPGEEILRQNIINTLIQMGYQSLEQHEGGTVFIDPNDYAVRVFQEALSYDKENLQALYGLSCALYKDGNTAQAAHELKYLLNLYPDHEPSLKLLGLIEEGGSTTGNNGNLDRAYELYSKARELDPSDLDLSLKLNQLAQEIDLEKDYKKYYSNNFVLSLPVNIPAAQARIVLDALEEAYSRVGQSLQFYPEEAIQVGFYPLKEMQQTHGIPEWGSGFYDGKIRLPTLLLNQHLPAEQPLLQQAANHEVAHAFIYELSGGSTTGNGRCPAWLNEGLAQYFEDLSIPQQEYRRQSLEKALQNETLPNLEALPKTFIELQTSEAEIAYSLSWLVVDYMVHKYNFYTIQSILQRLAAGETIASGATTNDALENEIYINLELLQKKALKNF